MKKLLLGCLGLTLVLGVVGLGAGYYFVWRPASAYLGGAQELAAVSEMNGDIANQASYTPPADSAVTEAQMDAFVAVQERMGAALGARLDTLRTKYERLEAQMKREGREQPTVAELMQALRDVSGLVREAKRAQVAALNARGLSLSEYRWVRTQTLLAMGEPVIDLSVIAEEVQSGAFSEATIQRAFAPGGTPGALPPETRALVEEHADAVRKTIGLAVFGL
jgi:hypothetical protein